MIFLFIKQTHLLLASILVGDGYFYVLAFTVIIVLLFFSALISASEVAFFSLKANDLERCLNTEDSAEKNILELLKKPRLLLATILIMNNLVNVGVVTIATFLMWKMAGTHSPAETIVGIVTFGVTFAITFFGEIIPKVYATRHNWTFARRMSHAWLIVENIWRPISFLLLKMSLVIEKRIEKKGYSTTVEELNHALDLTTDNDETSAEEKDILKSIVNFGTLTVKQVMKSRMDISAVDIDLNFIELIKQVTQLGFSRIPVYIRSLDHIQGVLYIKDLIPFLHENENYKWQKLLRPSYFIPETKKLDSLLKDFQNKHVHMAIVVDEYGGTSGLITLEDLIEEIIGEINDEFDEVNSGFHKIDSNTYIFEGKTLLLDFCKALNVDSVFFDEVKGEAESLGGLILELHGSLPKVGEHIQFEQFTFVVLMADQKKIKKVKILVKDELKNSEE